jgi:hypothetical protein
MTISEQSVVSSTVRLVILAVAVLLLGADFMRALRGGGIATASRRSAVRIEVPDYAATNSTVRTDLPASALLRASGEHAPAVATRGSTRTLWQTMDARSYNSPKVRAIMSSWDTVNHGINHIVHNDSEAAEFMRTTFNDEVADVYAHLDLPVMRADMWRYVPHPTRGYHNRFVSSLAHPLSHHPPRPSQSRSQSPITRAASNCTVHPPTQPHAL